MLTHPRWTVVGFGLPLSVSWRKNTGIQMEAQEKPRKPRRWGKIWHIGGKLLDFHGSYKGNAKDNEKTPRETKGKQRESQERVQRKSQGNGRRNARTIGKDDRMTLVTCHDDTYQLIRTRLVRRILVAGVGDIATFWPFPREGMCGKCNPGAWKKPCLACKLR